MSSIVVAGVAYPGNDAVIDGLRHVVVVGDTEFTAEILGPEEGKYDDCLQ